MGMVAERVERMEKLRKRISNGSGVQTSKTNINVNAYVSFGGLIIEERLFKRCALLKNPGVPKSIKGNSLLFVDRKAFDAKKANGTN